jgi:GPH family glycoside/pentoside/hexuronide:cation symporter
MSEATTKMRHAADVVQSWKKSGPEPGFYKLPQKEVIGYSLVDFAMNLVFQCIMMYITFYYTDVYGLAARDVALMFLLSRIWDAFNDPMMGTIVERLNPKRGKYKAYLFYGALPFGILAVLTYTVPNIGYVGKLIWAYVMYNGLNMMYTFIIQPYAAAASIMTADPNERIRLQSTRMMFAQSGGVVVALAIPLVSGFFTKYMTLAQGYMATTILMAAIMIALLIYAYSTIVERISVTSHENKATIKDVFYQMTHNKPGVIMFLLFLGVYGFNTVQSSTGVYYMIYYAQKSNMVAWFSMMNVLPSVLGVPFVPFLTQKIKKKGTVILGLAFGALGSIILWFLSPTDIVLMMISRGIGSFGYGILMGILWSIITDPVEYGDWHTGRRLTAIVMTLIGLGIKFSMTIGGVLPTMILDYVKYVPNQPQTEVALTGIRFMSSILPFVTMVATIIIFAAFYDLDEKKLAHFQHEIAVRDGLITE